MGSFVRLVAILTSGIVLLGFAFFAVDEMDRGSKTQQNLLDRETKGSQYDPAPIAPTPDQEAAREQVNGTVHELVDDANDILLDPFTGIVELERSLGHPRGAHPAGPAPVWPLPRDARQHAAEGARDPRRLAYRLAQLLGCAARNFSPTELLLTSKSSAESGRPPGRPERGNQLGGSRAAPGRIADPSSA